LMTVTNVLPKRAAITEFLVPVVLAIVVDD
jgi:hypothetical protein